MKKLVLIIIITSFFASCNTRMMTKEEAYSDLYNEKPLSIIVLPPINRSVNVEAKEIFYSSLNVPFTQHGYYVLPPLLTMEILKEESAYDSELFLNNSMQKVGDLFGADAVLFTIIHSWSKSTILSTINVRIEYILKSTKTDQVLFNRIGDITFNPSTNSGSVLLNIASNMIQTAFTKEISVARSCNNYTIIDIPKGKYHNDFGTDKLEYAGEKEFRATVNY